MKRPARILAGCAIFLFFVWAGGRGVDQELASGGVLTAPASGGEGGRPDGVAVADSQHREFGPRPVRSVSACGASSIGPGRSVPEVTHRCADSKIPLTATHHQKKPLRWWVAKARQNKRDVNARGLTIRRLKREVARQYAPSFEHYFTVAALTYRVDRAMLERKGRCESVNFTDFYNETPIYNGEHAQGVMGFLPSTFNSTPYRGLDVRYDHLANIMAGAWMHAHGRGGEWACR